MNYVDQLGVIRAEIKSLQDQAKRLEAELKRQGPGRYNGELFAATVSTFDTTRTDWRAVAMKLNPSRQLITAHTKTTETTTVRVAAHRKEAA